MLRTATAEAAAADEHFKKLARDQGYMECLTVDGWQDTSRVHIEGVLILLGSQSYMEESEMAGSEHHGIAVAGLIETLYKNRESRLCSCVMDEAGQVGRAKRILRLRHPHWMLDACWAHQVNLMVKALLKTKQFADVTEKASKISTTLSQSSAKWGKRFYDIVNDTYDTGTVMRLLTVGATRWNSAQAMFGSQLRVRTACKVFCLMYSDDDDYPKVCNSWQDSSFWKQAEEAELMIRPLVKASFLLQCNGRTKADVIVMMFNIYHHLSEFSDGESYAGEVLQDIERRWHMAEQQLFLLAFALHPKYRMFMVDLLQRSEVQMGNWGTRKNVLSVARLVMASKFYFAKHRVWLLTTTEFQQQHALQDEGIRKDIVREHARALGIDDRLEV